MFRKVLIANRGEIALRVIRACRELGVQAVVAYSEADRDSLPVMLADEAVCVGPPAADKSYLNIPNVVSAALITGCDAVHPGYGFLAENAYLAEVLEQVGIGFIGPLARTIETFGDKVAARQLMRAAGVPTVPGSDDPLHRVEDAIDVARGIGYPVMIKAVAGGGGRGIRAARDERELVRQFPIAQTEAKTHFSNGALYLERLIRNARHIEIQILADHFGHVVWLGERDCSLQRRRQKIVEEAPSPFLDEKQRRRIGGLAAKGMHEAGYRNAGTMELLVDEAHNCYFMEVNCRIQVEHGVTEMVTGVDLVKEQLKIAAGEPLTIRQHDIRVEGHAIECRITSEDPLREFAPDSGLVEQFIAPGGPGIRVDSHCYSGYVTPPYYDSLLGKVLAWGRDRQEAIERMQRALREIRLDGVRTTIPYLLALLADPYVRRGEVTIDFVANHLESWSAGRRREAAAPSADDA